MHSACHRSLRYPERRNPAQAHNRHRRRHLQPFRKVSPRLFSILRQPLLAVHDTKIAWCSRWTRRRVYDQVDGRQGTRRWTRGLDQRTPEVSELGSRVTNARWSPLSHQKPGAKGARDAKRPLTKRSVKLKTQYWNEKHLQQTSFL